MESYVEIALIQSFLNHFLACLIAGYATGRVIEVKSLMLYSFILSLISCCFFNEWIPTLYILLELACFLTLFNKAIAMYCCGLCLHILMMLTLYLFIGGTFTNYTYFPPVHYNPIFIWLFMIFIITLLLSKWGHLLTQASFVYEIKFDDYKTRGYLDSGNNAMWEGYPILFVSESLYRTCVSRHIVSGNLHTIGYNSEFSGKVVNALIPGSQLNEVIVIASCDHFPLRCECLLNLNQMTRMEKL